METPKKPAYQFPRNQCIACNNDILDRYHPLLLFGNSQEAENIRLKFEKLTELTLNKGDSFPKKICLRCKVKLDSALGFQEMCLESRKRQEEMLKSREKRGRNCEESTSPFPKRTPGFPSAAKNEGQKARKSVMSRYGQILPKPAVQTEPAKQDDSAAEEPHFLSKCGSQKPKVGVFKFQKFVSSVQLICLG